MLEARPRIPGQFGSPDIPVETKLDATTFNVINHAARANKMSRMGFVRKILEREALQFMASNVAKEKQGLYGKNAR